MKALTLVLACLLAPASGAGTTTATENAPVSEISIHVETAAAIAAAAKSPVCRAASPRRTSRSPGEGSAIPSTGRVWREGVADTTLGRFGTWPEYAPEHDNKYEDNLVARIHPDRIERTVFNAYFEMSFVARDEGDAPGEPEVSIIDRNWVFKRINVDRGDCSHRVAYNSISPGFLVSSEEGGFALSPADPFGRIAWTDGKETVVVDLGEQVPGDIYYDRLLHGDWNENWMLLWFDDGVSLEVQVPILVVFSDHPGYVRWRDGELFVSFDKAAGGTTDVLVAFLDGVGWRTLEEVGGWAAGLPSDVENKCRNLSKRLLPFISSCLEEFSIDEAAGTVTIRNSFGTEPWQDAWGTDLEGAAPYPPVASYAASRNYPVDFSLSPVDFETPTKLGPFLSCPGRKENEYTIPLAPLWNMNLVPPEIRSPWIYRAAKQAELWATNFVWNLDQSEGGGAWSLSTAKGIFESLPVMDRETREFYLHRCGQVLDMVLLDFEPEGPWTLRQTPGTNIDYHYLPHFEGHPDYPGDQDCGSAAPLEFICHYALHTGDWSWLAGEEDNIRKIFKYLAVASDWAWMASSCRDYGGGGAFLDMFPSQWMGYVSYARMGRVLAKTASPGWEDEAAFAWYLASKGMIPLTQRLDYKDGYAGAYWDFEPDETITGFGEYEPKPHEDIHGFWCGAPYGSMIDYDAFLISGEGFHPLVDEVYNRFVPDEYYDIVEMGFELNGGLAYNLNDAHWPYTKIHAFEAVGWDAAEIDSMWRDMHREDYYYKRLIGPSGLTWHSYMFARRECRAMPVRAIGAWEPARLAGAIYKESGRRLTLGLENDGVLTENFELVLVVDEAPVEVLVDGSPVFSAFDPTWGTVRITVEDPGFHSVVVQFDGIDGCVVNPSTHTPDQITGLRNNAILRTDGIPDLGGPWRAPGANRVINGGFEECGDRPNWMRPWNTWDLEIYDYPVLDEYTVHSGDYSMKLRCSGVDDKSCTYQNIYIGPHSSYKVSFWYNIPQDLGDDTGFSVACQEYDDENPAADIWRGLTIPGLHSPTDGWEYAEIVVEPHAQLPDCVIVRLHVSLKDVAGAVYVDDIALKPEP